MQPDRTSNEFNGQVAKQSEAAALPPRSRLLDQAVQQTLANLAADSTLTAEDRMRLHDVARRHRDTELTTAIVAEMVRATFPALQVATSGDAASQSMYEQVAAILHDDPVAGPRLQRIWDQLQKTAI